MKNIGKLIIYIGNDFFNLMSRYFDYETNTRFPIQTKIWQEIFNDPDLTA